MAIGMQGGWFVRWTSKSAAWGQRFRIEGSTNGVDGTYGEDESVYVTGDQWGVTVEHNPPGPEGWSASRHRLANFRVSGGLFEVDIESDDGGGGDEDFNDLIITCSMPLTESDWVLYGTIKTYSGFCGFNPCFPLTYAVIDTLAQLERLLEYADVRRVIEKLYPEEVKAVMKRPFPIPDPPPFRPMLIPTGLSDASGLIVKGTTQWEVPSRPKGKAKTRAAASKISVTDKAAISSFVWKSQTARLTDEDLYVMGKIKDLVLKSCDVNPVADTLLRFVEYDRTASELAGGAYEGAGNRETLGMTATDEFGNYVFRFSRTISQILAEATDIAIGEDATEAACPDVIVQIMESLPEGVAYETAPYYNVPNIRRINLCIPESKIVGVENPCQAGRAIQFLGNISILPNPHSELHADGTVTNRSSAATGPVVQHAAWYHKVHVYGCFEDTTPKVVRYTLEYFPHSEPGAEWQFVNENYEYLKQQPDATWDNARVGPFDHSLRIHGPGDPKVTVPAYDNIEEDNAWAVSHRHRKIILRTWRYQPESGAVSFRIQGYDASGEKVPGANDEFKLFIDNLWSSGDVDFVKLVGGADPGECALLELAEADSPLQVRYRVRDLEGFLDAYNLKVFRGSNTPVGINGTPISGAYQDVAPFRYFGTPDESVADINGYVEVTVTPVSSDWLGGNNFCAFSFELWSHDRLTNGYGTPGWRILWRELVGLSLTT